MSATSSPAPRRGMLPLGMIALVLLVVVLNGSAAVAEPGDLDAGFGNGGMVLTDFGGSDEARAVTVSGGRIVVAGVAGGVPVFTFAVALYTANGSLDTSFGRDGIVTTAIGEGDAVGNAVAAQPDGKLLVAGYTGTANAFDLALVRYNPDGSLDGSFGSSGIVVTGLGPGDDIARDVAVDRDGAIVVAASSAGGDGSSLVLLRYTTDGQLDAAFGTGGIARAAPVGPIRAAALSLTDDGIVVGTISDDQFRLVAYADGRFGTPVVRTLAPGFDRTDGMVWIGRQLLGITGGVGGHFAVGVQDYQAPGTRNAPYGGFGQGGIAVADFGRESVAMGLTVLTDRRIIAVGGAGSDFAIAAFQSVADEPPAPVMTPSPPPPSPTATPTPSRPPMADDILLQDNFDDPSRGVMPRSVDDPQTAVAYTGGEYQVRKVRVSQGISMVRLPGEYRDSTIAIDARLVGEFVNHLLYVGCRDSAAGGYRLFIVPGERRFRIVRYSPSGPSTLTERTSSAIRPGNERNRIQLTCAGNTLTATINDTQVASVSDDSFRQGSLWIGVSTFSGVTALTDGRFDNLVVTQR